MLFLPILVLDLSYLSLEAFSKYENILVIELNPYRAASGFGIDFPRLFAVFLTAINVRRMFARFPIQPTQYQRITYILTSLSFGQRASFIKSKFLIGF
jgi:hypothetical protein